MKKVNNEKETIIKLYRDNISEIIRTHRFKQQYLMIWRTKNHDFRELIRELEFFLTLKTFTLMLTYGMIYIGYLYIR